MLKTRGRRKEGEKMRMPENSAGHDVSCSILYRVVVYVASVSRQCVLGVDCIEKKGLDTMLLVPEVRKP